jgi:hypothetical protein
MVMIGSKMPEVEKKNGSIENEKADETAEIDEFQRAEQSMLVILGIIILIALIGLFAIIFNKERIFGGIQQSTGVALRYILLAISIASGTLPWLNHNFFYRGSQIHFLI